MATLCQKAPVAAAAMVAVVPSRAEKTAKCYQQTVAAAAIAAAAAEHCHQVEEAAAEACRRPEEKPGKLATFFGEKETGPMPAAAFSRDSDSMTMGAAPSRDSTRWASHSGPKVAAGAGLIPNRRGMLQSPPACPRPCRRLMPKGRCDGQTTAARRG